MTLSTLNSKTSIYVHAAEKESVDCTLHFLGIAVIVKGTFFCISCLSWHFWIVKAVKGSETESGRHVVFVAVVDSFLGSTCKKYVFPCA